MIHTIGYIALSLNLISMSMKNMLNLRICSLIANAIYIAYGIMLQATPIIIGCTIAVFIHSYRIYKVIKEKAKKDFPKMGV